MRVRKSSCFVAALATAFAVCLWHGSYGDASQRQEVNDRPIIGVLAQEKLFNDPYVQGSTYIAASYVKYLEGAGARVVPIRINLTEEEYTRLFHSINGLLLPGGDVDLLTSGFARAARIFYDLAEEANRENDYFPIWGTCQGFQELSVLTAKKWMLTSTNSHSVALPLNFTREAKTSRLFRDFPEDVMQALAGENITANFHIWSLSLKRFNNNERLRNYYRVLSTNSDGVIEYISTMEAYLYPFYAVQYHPEKTNFEWIEKPGMVHTTSAVKASFHFAIFFVSEAKKSNHKFPSPEEEEKALIYNFPPIFTSTDFVFVQNYYFD